MSERYKILDPNSAYFITFATVGWVDVFTRKKYRGIVLDSLRFCQIKKGLVIYAWCLMSNHIHMVIGKSVKGPELPEIVRDFKKFTSVQICRAIEENDRETRREWMLNIFRNAADQSEKHSMYKFWQNQYHPIQLFSNGVIDQKIQYIHNNPVRAGIVENPQDYLYSSARNYVRLKGLLEVELA
jgi:putative transposase